MSEIDGALEELNPGAKAEEIRRLESELDLCLPQDFKYSCLIHNGQRGESFLLGWRLWPLGEILGSALEARKVGQGDAEVFGDSGRVKECGSNPLWVCFADNGGNGCLAIDLDPGRRGKRGQIIALYEGGAKLQARSYMEFLTKTVRDIESGDLVWDAEAGGFTEPPSEEEMEWNHKSWEIRKQINGASSFDELYSRKEGDEITLVGAVRPDHKTNRHRFYAKTHSIYIEGPIGRVGGGLSATAPFVKVSLRVGKSRLFGLLGHRYEVLACEPIS